MTDIYSIETPCPECGVGTIKFSGSRLVTAAGRLMSQKRIYRDEWKCDTCPNIEYQDKTDWVMDSEREPDLDKHLKELRQKAVEMLGIVHEVTKEFQSKNQLITK